MIKKTENCLYCKSKMESKTAKKKFCSPLCRVYFNREKKAAKALTGIDSGSEKLTPSSPELISAMNNSVLFRPTSDILAMPVKEKGENSIDFAARKNEWKLKYNQ